MRGYSTMLRPLRDMPDSVVNADRSNYRYQKFGPQSAAAPALAEWPVGGDALFVELGGRAYWRLLRDGGAE